MATRLIGAGRWREGDQEILVVFDAAPVGESPGACTPAADVACGRLLAVESAGRKRAGARAPCTAANDAGSGNSR